MERLPRHCESLQEKHHVGRGQDLGSPPDETASGSLTCTVLLYSSFSVWVLHRFTHFFLTYRIIPTKVNSCGLCFLGCFLVPVLIFLGEMFPYPVPQTKGWVSQVRHGEFSISGTVRGRRSHALCHTTWGAYEHEKGTANGYTRTTVQMGTLPERAGGAFALT